MYKYFGNQKIFYFYFMKKIMVFVRGFAKPPRTYTFTEKFVFIKLSRGS